MKIRVENYQHKLERNLRQSQAEDGVLVEHNFIDQDINAIKVSHKRINSGLPCGTVRHIKPHEARVLPSGLDYFGQCEASSILDITDAHMGPFCGEPGGHCSTYAASAT